MDNSRIIARAAEIIAQETAEGAAPGAEPACVLALMDEDGYPTASTITAAKAGGIRWLTFGTGLRSNKARRIQKCGRAAVCFTSPQHNITLVGDIEVVTDPAVKAETWYQGLASHFTGPDDPNFCVLRFTTRRYSLLVDWQEAEGRL